MGFGEYYLEGNFHGNVARSSPPSFGSRINARSKHEARGWFYNATSQGITWEIQCRYLNANRIQGCCPYRAINKAFAITFKWSIAPNFLPCCSVLQTMSPPALSTAVYFRKYVKYGRGWGGDEDSIDNVISKKARSPMSRLITINPLI